MPIQRKRGALSTEEMNFISENMNDMSYKQMASVLNRNIPPIKKYAETHELKSRDVEVYGDFLPVLRKKYYYTELKKQMTNAELKYFEYQWCDYMRQFNRDVNHSEEMQILEMIRTEILINRGMEDRKNVNDQIDDMEALIEEELDKEKDDRDKDMIAMLKQQVGSLMGSKSAYTNEHKNLLDKKEKMMRDLKATRDQRKKNAEDAKTNFSLYLKQIIEDERLQKEMEFEMEMQRIAADKAKVRLSEYHTYADNVLDQPILTSETMKEEDEDE